MKNYLLIPLLTVILFCTSCTKNAVIEKNGEYTLPVGACTDEAANSSLTYKVCFNKLITESRCPSDAVCVWAGYAEAEFSLTKGQQTTVFKLQTLKNSIFRMDTTINGVTILLVDILPHPVSNKPSKDIKAVIKIN